MKLFVFNVHGFEAKGSVSAFIARCHIRIHMESDAIALVGNARAQAVRRNWNQFNFVRTCAVIQD